MIFFFLFKAETAAFFDAEGYVHTGDLARYDENGILYFEGRLKELIKIKVTLKTLSRSPMIQCHQQTLA